VSAEWAQTTSYQNTDNKIIDNDNNAIMGQVNWKSGDLSAYVGYDKIDFNFFRENGYWGRFGRLINMVDVKGPKAGVSYNFSEKFSGALGFQNYDTGLVTGADDKVTRWTGNLKFGLCQNYHIGLDGEIVVWDPNGSGASPRERYWTISVMHPFSEQASVKFLYQIVDYDSDNFALPYGNSYKGGLAAVQATFRF
jgi:hypothetical protein